MQLKQIINWLDPWSWLRSFCNQFPEFALKIICLLDRFLLNLKNQKEYDLVYVLNPASRGWVLDRICQEINRYFKGNSKFCFRHKNLPPAKAYFFSHYSLYANALFRIRNTWVRNRKSIVFYTHPRELPLSDKRLYYSLNKAHKIIAMNAMFADRIVSKGIDRNLVKCVIGGADPQIFTPHSRGKGCVGFSSAYYERKNPGLLIDLIKLLPDNRFLLLGKGWDQYSRFKELDSLPNFSYIEAPYSDYPRYYKEMDVFVSPSNLEGGPIPLIETMMCNIVPVASKTGFAPDIIQHGQNGFLFEVGADAQEVSELVIKAIKFEGNINKSVENYTWEKFSNEIQKQIFN